MLLCLSASHRSADFSLLERLSAAERTAVDHEIRGVAGVDGVVLLATCNRYELYVDAAEGVSVLPRVRAAMSRALGVSEAELSRGLVFVPAERVPEYLFAVTSGLHSVAVGEGEISGQVRRALEEARDAGLTTASLEHLFQTASTASKGVKQQTDLQQEGRSLVRLALDLAESTVSDWATARVLLIGTGAYAGATLKALEDRGVTRVSVHSPSGRATGFAERHGIAAVADRELGEALSSADLVVTCSRAGRIVLDHDRMRTARLSPGRPDAVLVIDMGMPRNVDPLVAKLDGVDLLDLETIRLHVPLDDFGAAEEARCIVARAASEFSAQQAEAELSHAIAALRKHISGIAEQEIARAEARDPSGTTAVSLRRLTNTILHDPSVRAKELARTGRGDEYIRAIEVLFGIRGTVDVGGDDSSGGVPAPSRGDADSTVLDGAVVTCPFRASTPLPVREQHRVRACRGPASGGCAEDACAGPEFSRR